MSNFSTEFNGKTFVDPHSTERKITFAPYTEETAGLTYSGYANYTGNEVFAWGPYIIDGNTLYLGIKMFTIIETDDEITISYTGDDVFSAPKN